MAPDALGPDVTEVWLDEIVGGASDGMSVPATELTRSPVPVCSAAACRWVPRTTSSATRIWSRPRLSARSPTGSRSGEASPMETETPNPGSDEALERGCRCPVLDNAHGRGYMGGMKDDDGNTVFVIVGGCPLHWPDPDEAPKW